MHKFYNLNRRLFLLLSICRQYDRILIPLIVSNAQISRFFILFLNFLLTNLLISVIIIVVLYTDHVYLTLVLLSPFFCSTQKFGFICFALNAGTLSRHFFYVLGEVERRTPRGLRPLDPCKLFLEKKSLIKKTEIKSCGCISRQPKSVIWC